MNDALCRGSWLLGTACGKCPRCIEEAGPIIRSLRDNEEKLTRKLTRIHLCLIPQVGPNDITDTFKVTCFNEARRIAQEDKG